jgi:hypothetical protein
VSWAVRAEGKPADAEDEGDDHDDRGQVQVARSTA